MSLNNETLRCRPRMRKAFLRNALQRREAISERGIDVEANSSNFQSLSRNLSPGTTDIFTSPAERSCSSSLRGRGSKKIRAIGTIADRVATRILTSFSSCSPPPPPPFAPRSPPSRTPPSPLSPIEGFGGSFIFEDTPTINIDPGTPSPSSSAPSTPPTMDRRRGALPMGQGGPAPSVPQYLTQDSMQSNGSTNSEDSFRTQVPLPYHIPANQFGQDFNFGGTPFQAFATPVLPQPSRFDNRPSKLNPASSPYVPTGNTPVLAQQDFQAQSYPTDYSPMDVNAPYQQGQQMVGAHYPAMAYQPMPNMTLGGPVGGTNFPVQTPYSNGMAAPYGQFGVEGPVQNNYAAQIPYNTSSVVSPVPSFGNMNPSQNFGMQYGPGLGNGISQPYNAMYHGSTNSMHNGGSLGGVSVWGAKYDGQNRGSGFNGGGSEAFNGREHNKSYKYQHNKPMSNFNAMERAKSSTPKSQRSESTNPKLGGPVLAPPKILRTDSPGKSVGKGSDQESSRGRQNSVVEGPSAGLTPSRKSQPPKAELDSESRSKETPPLRSRQGQSLTRNATDPNQKQLITNWAAGIETSSDTSTIKLADLKDRGSPVKTLDLINAADPFPGTSALQLNHSTSMVAFPDPYPGAMAARPIMSPQLIALTDGGNRKPTVHEALDPQNLPFAEYCRLAKHDNWGVIKIKNIPYSVTRAEILAFVGRNARIISESESEPIHIIMERVTSKTLDCYVEFVDFGEAVAAVNRFDLNRMGGRGGRLGQRHVDVELSTQEALMKDLFPKAKNVVWEGSKARVVPRNPSDMYNSGFQGFISREELVMLVKHVESPQRSPFSKDCPQRPFECLISTLLKYPWYMVDYITIEDRNMLHKTTKELLILLMDRVHNERDNVNISSMLLKRVWRAALKCPGFTPAMKDDIIYLAGLDDRTAIEYGVPPFAAHWKYLWTIGPKPNVPTDVLLYYIALIRETTEPNQQQLSLAEQAEMAVHHKEPKLFGDLDKHRNYGREISLMTLAQVAKIEWAAIEKVLRCAFSPALEASTE